MSVSLKRRRSPVFQREQLDSLASLLRHLNRVTGYKFALLDPDGQEVYSSSIESAFCSQLKRLPGGRERCVACDREMALHAQGPGLLRYRCHAGLIEVAVPVAEAGRVVATVVFGQLLDQTPVSIQWQATCARCSWHPAIDALHRAFLQLHIASEEEIESCAQIVRACVSEVRLRSLAAQDAPRDGERLLAYIDSHYAAPLSLDILCRALSMGKTKLCTVAARECGAPVSRLINARRIAAARILLETTDRSIQQIAGAVGIADYNYFTKVFKSICGMTPSAYRRQRR